MQYFTIIQFIIEAMLVRVLRNKVSIRRLPVYSFCTNKPPESTDNKPLQNKTTTLNKPSKSESKTYLMLPFKSFLFQSKPLSIKIDRVFHQLLTKHDLKEAIAFPLKDEAKEEYFEITSYTDLKTRFGLVDVKEKNQSSTNFAMLRVGHHHPLMYKTEEVGIPFIKSIDDIYPVGTLCDISVEESYESFGSFYLLTLTPKNKVTVNVEQNKQLQQFMITGVSHYESFNSDILESAPFEMKHLARLYDTVQDPIKSYYQNRQSVHYDDNYLQNNLMSKGSLFLNQMCCFICNSAYYLSGEQKFMLYKQKTLKGKVDLLYEYYKGYTSLFAKIWNATYDEKQMGSPQSVAESLKFLQGNMQNILKIKIQSDPEIESLRNEINEGKEKGIFPDHVLEVLETEMRDIEDAGSVTMNHETKSKKHRIKTILSYPFGKFNSDNYNIEETKKILDEDHYGMRKVKERIIEFLAVGSLHGSVKSKVILLHGPPGVGKTSIVKSIARCMGRPFNRISLGGETDPSTLRGHKRTYIGAYPGKIFESIKRSKVQNPIILLDEIDKMEKMSLGGSIQNVLMNILDPAQNSKFKDDFIDLQLDISNVLFVCTANKINTIIQPLLDRMEKINVDGYSSLEKKEIFNKYLLPKAIRQNGIQDNPITLDSTALEFMINGYNRQPGVRSLEQAINKLCQKIAYKIVTKQEQPKQITKELIVELLGTPTFIDHRMYEIPPAGVMVGLAYSELGGGIMYIEAIKSNTDSEITQEQKKDPKKSKIGKLTITGNLKTVIKESSQIAFSYANFILHKYFNNSYLDKTDVHLNFVGVATPKQGPSAGAAITSTLISLALNKPANKEIAMTGEINLSGNVTKIGGVKEKVLAAKREGIVNIILPMDNKNDFEKLDDEIKTGINVTFAAHYFDVMKELFGIDLTKPREDNPVE